MYVNVQRRQEARRNGFLPCIQYPEAKAASSTTTASSHLSVVKEAEEGAAAAAAEAAQDRVASLEENGGDEDKVRKREGARVISPNSLHNVKN